MLINPIQASCPGATHLPVVPPATAGLRLVPRNLGGDAAGRLPQPLLDAAGQGVGAGPQAAALQAQQGRQQGYGQQGNGVTPWMCPQGEGQHVPWLLGGHTSPSCCPSALVCWRSACPSRPAGCRGSPGGHRCRGRGSSPVGETGRCGQPPSSPKRGKGACSDASSSQGGLRQTRRPVLNLGSRVSQMPRRLEGRVSCREPLMLYVPGPSLASCRREQSVRMSWVLPAALPASLGPQEMCMEGGSTSALTWSLRFFFITLKWKWGSWIVREPGSALAQQEAGTLPCKAEPEHRGVYIAAPHPAAHPGSVAHPDVRHPWIPWTTGAAALLSCMLPNPGCKQLTSTSTPQGAPEPELGVPSCCVQNGHSRFGSCTANSGSPPMYPQPHLAAHVSRRWLCGGSPHRGSPHHGTHVLWGQAKDPGWNGGCSLAAQSPPPCL